jgi:hypothetical protein
LAETNQRCTSFEQNVPEPGIHGIFHRHPRAGPYQDATKKIKRLLATIGNNKVVVETQSSFTPRFFEQIGTKRFVSAGSPQLKDLTKVSGAENLVATFLEIFDRKQLFRRPRCGEADGRCPNGRLPNGALQNTRPVNGRLAGALRHKAAAPDLSRDETLLFQQFVSGRNGSAIDAKQTSQFASGREPLSAREISPLDLALKTNEKLLIEGRQRRMVEIWQGGHSGQL